MTNKIIYTPERIIATNGIEICTDAFGDVADPALILLNGQGGQLIMWDEIFCQKLAGQGLYVVRFDHRDVGLSTHLDNAPLPDMTEHVRAWLIGGTYEPLQGAAYTLFDMVDDTVGLMDGLGISQAHLMGISMGGMISKLFALKHPERMHSLILYASSPGKPGLAAPTPEAAAALMKPSVDSLEERIEQGVASAHAMGGPKHTLDEARSRRRIQEAYERNYDSAGAQRQLAAVFATPSQYDELKTITVPTLVIHGDQDPLLPLSYGEELAKQIPGAKLHVLKNIGHSLPPDVFDEVVEAVVEHTK